MTACALRLQVIDEEGLQANSAAVGEHLLARMHALAAKHDIIGDVRGAGLMLGLELVRDRTTKARHPPPPPSVCSLRGGDAHISPPSLPQSECR